jgi:hypothetical protein
MILHALHAFVYKRFRNLIAGVNVKTSEKCVHLTQLPMKGYCRIMGVCGLNLGCVSCLRTRRDAVETGLDNLSRCPCSESTTL